MLSCLIAIQSCNCNLFFFAKRKNKRDIYARECAFSPKTSALSQFTRRAPCDQLCQVCCKALPRTDEPCNGQTIKGKDRGNIRPKAWDKMPVKVCPENV